jgi:glycosyltransferase involved in cell wall biosynthesis
MAAMPSLSVVMPNFNHARYLPAALDALLGQSVAPAEVLVFDDASTDGSVALLEAYGRRHPALRLFRNPENRGPVHGMNRGLETAAGDYVFFMAADDLVLPGFVERSLSLLSRWPDAGLCSCLSRVIDAAGADQGIYRSPVVRRSEGYLSPRDGLRALRHLGPWFMGNTTIYRRQALAAAGGFDPALRSLCDGFIAQLLTLRHGACFIPEPLACWRKTQAGYADADNADWQQRLALRERAAHLMRTTFADAFPAEYVRHWERQSRYAAGVAGWRQIRAGQEVALGRLLRRLVPTPGSLEACCLWWTRRIVGASSVAVRLYLFLRHRGLAGWLVQKLARFATRL